MEKLKILVVDDESRMRKLVRDFLVKQNFEVLEAGDGEEALDVFYKNKDIHIHAPEGAVPKDGPSAGISMATAMISALSNIPVKGNVAMTGEITLRGRVLPIGGLKEKSMAAYRNGIKTVIIPEDNLPDLALIADVVKSNVEFIPAKVLDTVLDNALVGGIPKNNNSKIKPESKDDINIQSEKITNAIAQ